MIKQDLQKESDGRLASLALVSVFLLTTCILAVITIVFYAKRHFRVTREHTESDSIRSDRTTFSELPPLTISAGVSNQ